MKLVTQRAEGDCGLCSLATYFELTYEDVYLALAQLDQKHRGKSGISLRMLMLAAESMGIPMRRKSRKHYDLDKAEGLIVIKWKRPRKGATYHLAVLYHGLIIDPSDATIMDVDEYTERFGAVFESLLVAKETKVRAL